MIIQGNYSLQALNTLNLPSFAQYFSVLDDKQQLSRIFNFAKEKQLKIIALGEGSNVILTADIPALVLKINLIGCSSFFQSSIE